MRNGREFWAPVRIYSSTYRDMRLPTWHATIIGMDAAIRRTDPFQVEPYWPLHNVGYYLGRMGVE